MPSNSIWINPRRRGRVNERPVADGIIETGPTGNTQIRFDRRLAHPIERVWAALTDPDQLREW